jgi:riboflavin synthase
MFTGLVTAVGSVRSVVREDRRLRLEFFAPYRDLEMGESIAVNGACLTVVEIGDGWFAVDAVATTRERTTLSRLETGHEVNLERALRMGERLGGHMVQGHVDGVGEVVGIEDRDDALLIDVRVPAHVADVSVLHGSITVDGVSLTVNALPEPDVVQVALIPHTRVHTTLGRARISDAVQLEGDLIGKFVQQLMRRRD